MNDIYGRELNDRRQENCSGGQESCSGGKGASDTTAGKAGEDEQAADTPLPYWVESEA